MHEMAVTVSVVLELEVTHFYVLSLLSPVFIPPFAFIFFNPLQQDRRDIAQTLNTVFLYVLKNCLILLKQWQH
jgi:hypothetical protein